MTIKWDGIERRQSLRTKAEAMLGSLSPNQMAAQPSEILMHELLVHKVELEMQIEELRMAQAELELARDHYYDLYEFAPVGYFALNRKGLITETNLKGAAFLGVDRAKLINQRFSKYIAKQEKDRWYRLFLNIMDHPKGKPIIFGLEMIRDDGKLFKGHLDCLRKEETDALPLLRVALTDLTEQQTESEQVA
jgi:PAS domain S-box-containing protein